MPPIHLRKKSYVVLVFDRMFLREQIFEKVKSPLFTHHSSKIPGKFVIIFFSQKVPPQACHIPLSKSSPQTCHITTLKKIPDKLVNYPYPCAQKVLVKLVLPVLAPLSKNPDNMLCYFGIGQDLQEHKGDTRNESTETVIICES